MNKLILAAIGAAMALPAGTMAAAAHPGPPHSHVRPAHGARHHYRRARRYRPYRVEAYRRRRRPVIVVAPPAPPPIIYVEEPPPRVTVMRRRPEPARVVRRPAAPPVEKKSHDRMLLGIGIRGTAATLEGGKLGLDTAENPAMGGIGIQLRTRLGRSMGLELSADFLAGDGDDFSQSTIPVMASFTYHLFPRSRIQPYILAGAGVHFTRLEYLDGQYNIDMVELAGQLGAGLEVFLTKNIAIQADIRAQTIFKNLDTQAKIRDDCLHQIGAMRGFCDGINSADPDDKFNLGLQFQAGATWYF